MFGRNLAAVLTASVLLTGCMSALYNKPDVAAPMAALRSRTGVCATAVPREFLEFATIVDTCIQVGTPGTLNDDGKTAIVVAHFRDSGWQLSNPGNWQVEVFNADGVTLLKRMLTERVPDVGPCTASGCTKRGLDVFEFPPGWSPGTYRIRYTCAFDTSIVANLSITLTGTSATQGQAL